MQRVESSEEKRPQIPVFHRINTEFENEINVAHDLCTAIKERLNVIFDKSEVSNKKEGGPLLKAISQNDQVSLLNNHVDRLSGLNERLRDLSTHLSQLVD